MSLHPFAPVIGSASKLRAVLQVAERVAPTDLPVIVLGESGTGKELVAQGIHKASRQAAGPLVTVNCGALPAQIVESELFGHERGAFTGAGSNKAGWFESAHGGTLVLDEIGEMPLDIQPKLLRALESGVFHRVGSRQERRSCVRIVAMTNRDLGVWARSGRFRLDLYHRLAGIEVVLPALRERVEDIESLVGHFVTRLSADLGLAGLSGCTSVIEPAALSLMRQHNWPGNVRELRNMVRRALILEGLPIRAQAVRDALLPQQPSVGYAADALGSATQPLSPAPAVSPRSPESAYCHEAHVALAGRSWSEIRTDIYRWALHTNGGSRRAAARALQISKSTFSNHVRELGLG